VARTRRSRVTWVFGATLDGRVAAPDGTSRWISSEAARVDAHRLRAAHDAVLVGSGAARIDDPHLALRHGVSGRPPLRIVLDARAAIVTPASRVADEAAPTLIVIGSSAPDPALPAHVAIARVELDVDGRIGLPGLLGELGRRGVRTLLVEGGPVIAGSFLQAGLVDDVVGYVRAAVLGGGRPLLVLPGVTTIGDLRRFRLIAADVIGEDVRIRMTAPRARRASTSTPPPAEPASAADLAPAEPAEERPRA
jgi:diaminohydroxyphosphoribosylaminopyrimidine deaminase / 5-amino-6-(5-phosphoribosylamino)uracil reductase